LLYDDLKALLYKAFSQNYVFKVPYYGTKAYKHWYERVLDLLGLNPAYSGSSGIAVGDRYS
jgi:hypothetical protein